MAYFALYLVAYWTYFRQDVMLERQLHCQNTTKFLAIAEFHFGISDSDWYIY